MLGLIKALGKENSTPIAPLYPYDFPTSGFSRVDETRFLIEDQSMWDHCHVTETLMQNNFAAARLFGHGPYFNSEEAALGKLLLSLKAGPQIMTYAWGRYSDLVKSGAKSY